MDVRRRIVLVLGASALAAPLTAFAQQKLWRIGFLNPAAEDSRSLPRLRAFQEGMRELGYVEGRNLKLEVRWAEGKLDRLEPLAQELVSLKVDAIVVGTTPAADAALRATRTIPIVMGTSSDPVGDGQVASLSHPGGNITGLSSMAPELEIGRAHV